MRMKKPQWYEISISLKKGELKQHKPILKYINDTFYPEFLSFSQLRWYDMLKVKPIPQIEFKAKCIDSIDIIDDVIDKFPKQVVTAGSHPMRKWLVEPKPKKGQAVFIKKLHKERMKRWKNDS